VTRFLRAQAEFFVCWDVFFFLSRLCTIAVWSAANSTRFVFSISKISRVLSRALRLSPPPLPSPAPDAVTDVRNSSFLS
jgi:hypothetical protein